MPDRLTKRWIRNESDERAAAAGYRFDAERGAWTVWWIERYCRLYQGEWAGEPLVLRGIASVDANVPILMEWDQGGREASLERAEAYAEAYAAGEAADWQYDATMRMFGWVKHSERWDREVRRFTEASIWVAKKNKKSPTLAAWGLYMLVGDSEPGQNFYFAAKDGQQAREIAGKHAVEMAMSSPELWQELSLNKNSMQLTHEASRSTMRPLSSSNVRTKKSKEGFNGSRGIDEVHVVDRDFMEIISRMGISRSEPMAIEVSTSGDDPDGYGYERFGEATAVLAGKRTNHRLFAMIYAAPQDLADADLDADPVKYGKLANPSWGHTIDEEEYLADYDTSKDSPRKFGRFKMYRLNIWQRSTNPWLRPDDWAQCRQEFTEADLYGRPCGGGLDLARSEDMASFALVFPDETPGEDDNPVRALWWYWLPEAAVERHGHEVAYAQWAADGWLRVIPGPVIDFSYLERDVVEILGQYDVKCLGFDEHYAHEFTQRLMQQHGYRGELYKFPQTIMGFAGPTAQFERLVIAGKLGHRGNPITSWQAGHVQVWTDANQNMRPVKPKHGDIKKIDGIVASIMALDASQKMPRASPYQSRGFLTT
ncbi:hypothetical protein LCGC14_1489260 [marine sediment metagenome]|uniref:Terminase n=1 Tax=marine sediment metagenome TaxID=412755 RepID=A0A0F9J783_9ZZZZ